MRLHSTSAAVREALAPSAGSTVGFVPTMGALHDGHLSLVRAARQECDTVLMSIFVNPLQFGVGEDLDRYPRQLEQDLRLAEAAGVDHVFAPAVEEMYPDVPAATVTVEGPLVDRFEGALRPGHFDGVATVVAKLFGIAGPCRAYFGEKDWQQLAVVRRMTTDLSMPVTVVGCPTVRADNGLALSSRNAYLSSDEAAAATILWRALQAGVAATNTGTRQRSAIVGVMQEAIASEPSVRLAYADVVDEDFRSRDELQPGAHRLIISAHVGPARLLDNVEATVV